MSFRNLPVRLVQALFLIAILCAAGVTPLKAQQVADSTRALPRTSVPRSQDASTLGPRVSPQFQRVDAQLASVSTPGPLKVAAGQHVIVLSTLALVVVVVIITILVVK